MTATVTDLFCGAGGSSTGAAAAGLEIVLAANHWATAIEVHQANHPDAGHDCADISQVDPRRYPADGRAPGVAGVLVVEAQAVEEVVVTEWMEAVDPCLVIG